MRGKTITAVFRGQREARTAALYQYDYGQVLVFADLELPPAYEVHFGPSPSASTITMIGGADGVEIPDDFLRAAGRIYAWVYLHEGDSDGETEYVVSIQVTARGEITDEEPTPAQQTAIDAAIAALNAGVETVQDIAEAMPGQIEDALAEAKASGEFDGPPGPAGEPGPKGDPGSAGSPGRDGADGQPGADGVSPSVAVTEIAGGHHVSITDADGTQTFAVMDGQRGPQGETGPAGSPGTAGKDGKDGSPGAAGADGSDGVTFTPSVSAEGVISWTNDGGRTNPQSVNIKGPQGDPGQDGQDGSDYVLTAQDKADIAAIVGADMVVSVSGTTPSITAQSGYRYECGTLSTLSFTPSSTGCCDVVFSSGSTATVLTVPSTVKWPDWFDPDNLETNATYELNILNGVYGAVGVWT